MKVLQSSSLLAAFIIFSAIVFFRKRGASLKVSVEKSRGYRNNNPGNIKRGQDWLGLSHIQTDEVFDQFVSVEYGYRALAVLLINYERIYNISTVSGIISRYAPGGVDNNETESYISFVAGRLGVSSNEKISIKNSLHDLVAAISAFENGYIAHSDKMKVGVQMAMESFV